MKRYASIPELAEQLGRSAGSLRKACVRGEVPGAFQIGRLWKIDMDAFEAFTASASQRSSAA